MKFLRKASTRQVAAYAASGPVYPLAYISWMANPDGGELLTVHIEDLRGSWSRPDPVWEIRAPDGYQFDDGSHGRLEHTLADVREETHGQRLTKCTPDNGCGCEYEEVQS